MYSSCSGVSFSIVMPREGFELELRYAAVELLGHVVEAGLELVRADVERGEELHREAEVHYLDGVSVARRKVHEAAFAEKVEPALVGHDVGVDVVARLADFLRHFLEVGVSMLSRDWRTSFAISLRSGT